MKATPRHRWTAALLLVAFAAGNAWARDEEYLRLLDRFNQVATDPALAPHAQAAMDRARIALANLKEARRGDREHWVYVTERRIDAARAAAEAEMLETKQAQLQRENDRLQLALARRDAEQARAELERQRLQAQIRAEEAENARRDAEAARTEGAQAVEAARAETQQAKKMAAAQARAAALAKKEAELEASLGGRATPAKDKDKGKPARGKKPR
jgi:hypothetical protein